MHIYLHGTSFFFSLLRGGQSYKTTRLNSYKTTFFTYFCYCILILWKRKKIGVIINHIIFLLYLVFFSDVYPANWKKLRTGRRVVLNTHHEKLFRRLIDNTCILYHYWVKYSCLNIFFKSSVCRCFIMSDVF